MFPCLSMSPNLYKWPCVRKWPWHPLTCQVKCTSIWLVCDTVEFRYHKTRLKYFVHTLTNLFFESQARGIDIKNVEVGVSRILHSTLSCCFFLQCRSSSECWRPLAATRRWSSRWGKFRVSPVSPTDFIVDLMLKVLANALVRMKGPSEWQCREVPVLWVCVVFKDACEALLQQLIFRLWALRQRLPFPNMWPACTSDLEISHTFSLLLFPSWWWLIAVTVGAIHEINPSIA